MFTADNARMLKIVELDDYIQRVVNNSIIERRTQAHLRVFIYDSFFETIEDDLKKRGFHSVEIFYDTQFRDVFFSWNESKDDCC